MKKLMYTIVIAAIVATAGSAHAITLYQKDGVTYKIGGDWQIQLRQDPGIDQNIDVEFDDLEIKNTIDYELSDNLSAFGQLDFGFKNAADKSNEDKPPHLEEAYLGMKFKDFKLAIGKTTSAADNFGIEGFIEAPVAEDAFEAAAAVDGDDLIKASAKISMLSVIVAHELESEGESSDGNGTFSDVFVGVDIYGFSLGGAYQTLTPAEADDSINTWGVSALYDAKFAKFAADYSVASENDVDLTIWNIFVSVPIKSVTLGTGYQLASTNVDGDEDVSSYCVNAVYKFPTKKNVRLFAEIANSDEHDSDMGYLVGARIKF